MIISSLSFSLNCRLCWWNNKSRPLWAALFSDNLRTIIFVSFANKNATYKQVLRSPRGKGSFLEKIPATRKNLARDSM